MPAFFIETTFRDTADVKRKLMLNLDAVFCIVEAADGSAVAVSLVGSRHELAEKYADIARDLGPAEEPEIKAGT